MTRGTGTKFAILACCFLALAACSKKNTPNLENETGPGIGGLSPGSKDEFSQSIGDRVFFQVDQTTLTPEAEDTLRRQAAWLQKYQNVAVQVEGHADERGTREYNISLSARRATATREFLIAQGIPGNRISSIAFGKERPVALCDAEECWSQNRRAVTVITGGTN